MTKQRLSVRAIAGSGTNGRSPDLPRWMVKAGRRLAEQCRAPGVYAFAIIVDEDGTRRLVIEPGRTENLGR